MPFPSAHPNLLRALTEKGYTEPTPVQEAVLQPEADGRDLLVSAQTGSGKTAAYGLAIGSTLLGEAERFGTDKRPAALVVAPTRELALQVQRELSWLYAQTGARVVSCVGGMDVRNEIRALAQGAHIVVGTPGRLCDHLDRGRLDLTQLKALVLDEADEMLDLGFRDELEKLLSAAPVERRTLLLSATIPKEIATLAQRYQRNALRIALSAKDEPHGDIEYRAFMVAPQDVDHGVVNTLRFFDARGALVFCSTREAVRHLHANLLERGFAVVSLSGELSQNERTRALQTLRDGRARVCVATDVAARGLDLPDLGLVVHADLPHDRQVLLHRSGRTGRAGRKGLCILLVSSKWRKKAERLLGEANVRAAWSPAPSAEAVLARDQERLVRDISALAEEPTEEDLAAARILLEQRSPEQLAAALVRSQRSLLPAPEDLENVVVAPERVWASPPKSAGKPNRPSGPPRGRVEPTPIRADRRPEPRAGRSAPAGKPPRFAREREERPDQRSERPAADTRPPRFARQGEDRPPRFERSDRPQKSDRGAGGIPQSKFQRPERGDQPARYEKGTAAKKTARFGAPKAESNAKPFERPARGPKPEKSSFGAKKRPANDGMEPPRKPKTEGQPKFYEAVAKAGKPKAKGKWKPRKG